MKLHNLSGIQWRRCFGLVAPKDGKEEFHVLVQGQNEASPLLNISGIEMDHVI